MNVLIAGSRTWNKRTRNVAREFVNEKVHSLVEQGHTIIVGDNPDGVDRWVIDICKTYERPYYVISRDKHGNHTDVRYPHSNDRWLHTAFVGKDWAARDRWMCEYADWGLFVWNGKSNGTKTGFDYMKSLDKPCWLRQPGSESES